MKSVAKKKVPSGTKVKKDANNSSKGCPPDTFTSQKAAAKSAGVDIRTIQRWKSKGMPVIDLGGGRVGYTKAMLDRFKRMSEGDAQNVELKTEEIRHKSARASLAEMDLEARRGELIPADEVADLFKERVSAAKNVLMGLPTKLPARLKGKSHNRWGGIIREEVYYCLDILAGKKVKRGRRKF